MKAKKRKKRPAKKVSGYTGCGDGLVGKNLWTGRVFVPDGPDSTLVAPRLRPPIDSVVFDLLRRHKAVIAFAEKGDLLRFTREYFEVIGAEPPREFWNCPAHAGVPFVAAEARKCLPRGF